MRLDKIGVQSFLYLVDMETGFSWKKREAANRKKGDKNFKMSQKQDQVCSDRHDENQRYTPLRVRAQMLAAMRFLQCLHIQPIGQGIIACNAYAYQFSSPRFRRSHTLACRQ